MRRILGGRVDNVLDFAELKLRHMMKQAAELGDIDLAYRLAFALEQHQEGTVVVFFQDGEPYVREPEANIETALDNIDDDT